MRIHVTGARGFIGSQLCPVLSAAGHELRTSSADCDAVVHLANIAHRSASAAELHRVNVVGTIAQARAARAAGVRRFVYLSSIMAARSDDAYGRAKLEAEQALAEIAGLEVVILRPPLVYGPRVKGNFRALMSAISRGWPLPLGAIENRRSLVYVGNLCDAVVHCLQAARAAGRVYAVSDGAAVSTPQLCRALGAALGRPARLFPFPVPLLELAGGGRAKRLTRSFEVEDSAIRSELGWRPKYTFEEGLRVTADQYAAQAR